MRGECVDHVILATHYGARDHVGFSTDGVDGRDSARGLDLVRFMTFRLVVCWQGRRALPKWMQPLMAWLTCIYTRSRSVFHLPETLTLER